MNSFDRTIHVFKDDKGLPKTAQQKLFGNTYVLMLIA
jgi:hypothetical protein